MFSLLMITVVSYKYICFDFLKPIDPLKCAVEFWIQKKGLWTIKTTGVSICYTSIVCQLLYVRVQLFVVKKFTSLSLCYFVYPSNYSPAIHKTHVILSWRYTSSKLCYWLSCVVDYVIGLCWIEVFW